MGLMTYDLISLHDDLHLPTAVIDRFVDIGGVCNSFVEAIRLTDLGESRAQSLIDAAESDRRDMRYTRDAAHELALAALDHRDLLLLTYTKCAATYATYAVRVAAAVAAGRPAPEPITMPIRPADVMQEPHVYVPLVGLDQDEELTSTHTAVMAALSRMTGETARFYDGDRSTSRRIAGSVDIDASFPVSLHAYAAALAFAISSHFGPA